MIQKSVWKVDPIFKKMLNDSYFEPIILVCPYIKFGEKRMIEDLDLTYNYFKDKGYPVQNSYNHENGSWLDLNQLEPDLLFFTNPHNTTMEKYYSQAYNKYLSCYVPYMYLETFHDNEQSLYNYMFHNAMWKIFLPHSYSLIITQKIAANNGINAILTGYPACEKLFDKNIINYNIWKEQDQKKKKVIWAPHHSIDETAELHLSTFLVYAGFFKKLSKVYKDSIQWAFKPHPSLKSILYIQPDWGQVKTDEFYNYWATESYTQLEEGEYDDLFLQSDSMIHDSGSFLAEYLYVQKPVLYLMTNRTKSNLNEFGLKALASCFTAYSENDIEIFIENVLSEKPNHLEASSAIKLFYDSEILPFFKNKYPSEKIIQIIKDCISNA